MIYFTTYSLIGLIWSYSIDKYSSEVLDETPMQLFEIFLQICFWPLSVSIFSYTFLKEYFGKNN